MVPSRLNRICQVYEPGVVFLALRSESVSGNVLAVVGVFCVRLRRFFTSSTDSEASPGLASSS